MSIEQKTVIDRIEVVDAWFVQVRTAKMVLNDGEFAGRLFHSHVIAPGDDYSNEDARAFVNQSGITLLNNAVYNRISIELVAG